SGTRQLDTLRARIAGKAHFVGVGVGDGPDTQTLDALAAATGGYAATIDLSDDIGWRAFDLIAALHTSRVTGVTAQLVDAAGQLVPATAYLASAQLADGEELQLVAKLAGEGAPAAIQLTGTRGATPWKQTIALDHRESGEAGYLPRLWAQQHIAARLLAKHEPVVVPPCAAQPATRTAAAVTCPTEAELRNKRDEEIRQEIVTLGKQYFLLSRHTSLLVLENDAMYAQYGVRKGSGDTWAPYALPATIPVVTAPSLTGTPADVAEDAELVREPLQLFADTGYDDWSDDEAAVFGGDFQTIGTGRFGTIGHGSGTGSGYGKGFGGGMRGRGGEGESTVADQTRATLGLVAAQTRTAFPDAGKETDRAAFDPVPAESEARGGFFEGKMGKFAEKAKAPMPKKASISGSELRRRISGFSDLRTQHWSQPSAHRYRAYGSGPLTPARMTYPTDMAFDDVTAFIPALVPDAADDWREQLHAAAGNATSFPIDDASKRLLADARRSLPAGIYRWNELELIVDSGRRLGWRRVTDTGLAESASFDGQTWMRRYAELGLTATRSMPDDALALSFAYLPIFIAEPAQYARWFEVKARGAHEVTLSTRVKGKAELALVLTFDAQSHLVAISDAQGKKQLEVTWTQGAPTAARALGDNISVSFTPDPVTPATTWIESGVAPVVVELPTRVPAYWQARLAKETAGSPGWRHAQRQLMASAAALQDRGSLYRIYAELVEHGGVELGDLALASGGIATSTTDAQLASALAVTSIAKTPLAHYLIAGRAYGKAPRAARMKPETKEGVLGALWSLRYAEATAADAQAKHTADEVLAIDNRAFILRLLGVAAMSQSYQVKPEDALRMWDAVAIGDLKNLAQAQAVQMLANRGSYDLAAERFAKLAAELDLNAPPPTYNFAAYTFNYSRRGPAGYQLSYATLRDRVLAGNSFAHVMALVPLATQRPADVQALLARAGVLADKDPDRTLEVIRTAIRYNQQSFAQVLIDPMLKSAPTRELYQLAAQMAQGQNRLADALTYLEKAQQAGADEAVEINLVRSELTQIISLAQQVALQSQGAARKTAVEHAMEWAARWRMIDPGNSDIDRQIGNLLLAIGDSAGAWRQLSSTIERDPWSSAGYTTVADSFEQQGKVAEALELWQQAIVIDQTNPTPRLRKAQALIALGRAQEGDALLEQISKQKWHDVWSGVVAQAKGLLERGKPPVR
ncbi:MAG TPA: tetratricopeptide repeat protein, partial [Kofleriaceae bacterium]